MSQYRRFWWKFNVRNGLPLHSGISRFVIKVPTLDWALKNSGTTVNELEMQRTESGKECYSANVYQQLCESLWVPIASL